jgi:predicted ABC-type ATPase
LCWRLPDRTAPERPQQHAGTQNAWDLRKADDLRIEYGLTDLKLPQHADALRNVILENGADFSFETVLSNERNLLLLQKSKARGYEIQCIYVLTCDENINIARVRARHASGGHDVPEDKIRTRYHRALALLPQLIITCDKISSLRQL